MGGTIRGLTWIGLLFIHQSEGALVRGCRCYGSVISLVYLVMDYFIPGWKCTKRR